MKLSILVVLGALLSCSCENTCPHQQWRRIMRTSFQECIKEDPSRKEIFTACITEHGQDYCYQVVNETFCVHILLEKSEEICGVEHRQHMQERVGLRSLMKEEDSDES